MAASNGSGAVRSSALRTKAVRGTYGAAETYRIVNWVLSKVNDSFIWVPEINPVAVVHNVANRCETIVNGAVFSKPSAYGRCDGFYVIMPSYVGHAEAYGIAPLVGVKQGHHKEHSKAQVLGKVNDVLLAIVGYGHTKAEAQGYCNGTAILFEGKPAMRADENCCVFN